MLQPTSPRRTIAEVTVAAGTAQDRNPRGLLRAVLASLARAGQSALLLQEAEAKCPERTSSGQPWPGADRPITNGQTTDKGRQGTRVPRFARTLAPVALTLLALAPTGAAVNTIGWTEAHVIDKDVFTQIPHGNDAEHWPWTNELTKVYCAVDSIGIRFAGPPHTTFLLHRTDGEVYPSYWQAMEPGYERLPGTGQDEGGYVPTDAYLATAIEQCGQVFTGNEAPADS
ncbi:hypothetical protein [Nocardiopsis exhalans]|uniref:hypothetical protein n=1 Tax=Nocardiopsis exhalans TaxID=163604 RepID=UPI0031D10B2B